MRILGIETSCDECSLSVVENGRKILGLVTYSQLEEHKQFGGVVPELASRMHVQHISCVFAQLINELSILPQNNNNVDSQNISKNTTIQTFSRKEYTNYLKEYIDGIAVTVCPGLSGSLMVGLHFAKGLALALEKPLIGIDHILAHFYSGQLVETILYPYIGVVVSGGHTLIAIIHSFDTIEIIGTSIDDACGEAFEKIARALNLGYPGGSSIDRLARNGDIKAATFPIYSLKKNGYNFSYSGLKTAVIHHRDKYWNTDYPQTKEHISATFQHAAITMIVERVQKVVVESKIPRVSFGGGVACNSYLAQEIMKLDIEKVIIPLPEYCADNAAMIAGLGYQYLSREISSDLNIGVNARKYLYKAYKN